MAETTNLASQTELTNQSQHRTAEAIRQDIAAKRESISETVDRLGERINETVNWRSYVGRHPFVALGAAAGAGFMLAGFSKRSRSPRDRIIDALAESVEDTTDRVRANLDAVIQKKQSGIGYAMKAGITAVATSIASGLVKKNASRVLGGSRAAAAETRLEDGRLRTEDQSARSSTASSVRG